jgi:hypothetical protein
MRKIAAFKTTGMQRDLAASSFKPDFAYENKNIRISSTNDSTGLSLINEKGTKKVGEIIEGYPIGQAVIDNNLILFVEEGDTEDIKIEDEEIDVLDTSDDIAINDIETYEGDKIYQFSFDENNNLKSKVLFNGDLGFNHKYPIETLVSYESDILKKVYWTDGLNQPRVINISSDKITKSSYQFDFVRKLNLNENIEIIKNNTGGKFSAGVIQYAFQYYNKYGVASNIFYVSQLEYLADNRGVSPEQSSSCSFTIRVTNLDTSFDYLRVYSIVRTSIDTEPTVKIVTDLAINDEVIFTDNGNMGSIEDPTTLLYYSIQDISAYTMAQKDNTLFLGNINLKTDVISDEVKQYIRKNTLLKFVYKQTTYEDVSDYCKYKGILDKPASQVSTFKYGETYRIGVQFQYDKGFYSEVVYLGDIYNDIRPKVEDNTIYTSQIVCILPDKIALNYIRARLVMVPPSNTDRSIICQGILSPTVFNLGNRINNMPFAQSSWIMRSAGNHNKALAPNSSKDCEVQCMVNSNSIYVSDGDSTNKGTYTLTYKYKVEERSIDNTGGVETSYLSYFKLESSDGNIIVEYPYDSRTYESCKSILSSYIVENKIPKEEEWFTGDKDNPVDKTITLEGTEIVFSVGIADKIENARNNFYIDNSIVTFHSPDIESNYYRLHDKKVKLRILGYYKMDNKFARYSITSSTGLRDSSCKGKLQADFDELFSQALWQDWVTWNTDGDSDADKENTKRGDQNNYIFAIYMWNKGGLTDSITAGGVTRTSQLKRKVISNTRWSTQINYLNEPWEAYIEGNSTRTGISNTKVFNDTEVTNYILGSSVNSNNDPINYYGVVDDIINFENNESTYEDGYPVMGIRGNSVTAIDNPYTTVVNKDGEVYSKESISMRYKSSPHVVFNFNDTNDGLTRTLPGIQVNSNATSTLWAKDKSNIKKLYFQDPEDPLVEKQDNKINFSGEGVYFIGELYTEVNNQYGGAAIDEDGNLNEKVIVNNQWIPIGDLSSAITLIGNSGDTYYQRWDCLKTFSYSNDDLNSVVDITSFMVESRINLDGRYDNNRGQKNNLEVSNINFNIFNDVYSQLNNFFNYRNTELKLNYFPNQITWSKTKVNGDEIDAWANLTLASVLDMDGDKGEVRSIKNFNNKLIAFQDTGISEILYNESMQMTTTDGVPVEIANSGKVTGKRYITTKIGCANKWSICETPSGIYFIDDYTKGIYVYANEAPLNISDKFGFHSWINKTSKGINIWNPIDFDGFVTYYDKVNGDVFFITKDECLAFSELLSQFTSFYSYENTPYFSNLKDRGILFNIEAGTSDYYPWLLNEGDYNMFFGKYQPFYTTVVVNDENTKAQQDKIFDNLEFTSDSWKDDTLLNSTFDTLTVWNEYQKGVSKLNNIKNKPSSLKQKFRVWRTFIPRDDKYKMDRMRNPWLYLKLSMEKSNTNKTILHHLAVSYLE